MIRSITSGGPRMNELPYKRDRNIVRVLSYAEREDMEDWHAYEDKNNDKSRNIRNSRTVSMSAVTPIEASNKVDSGSFTPSK